MLTNNDIADILEDMADTIRKGEGDYLYPEAQQLCALYLGYKYPNEAEVGIDRKLSEREYKNRMGE